MDIDDETSNAPVEIGSDDLLSDDNLRLPESANILVRIHAVRAWLTRRYEETSIEVGEAALALQEMTQELQETRLRRRERQNQQEQLNHIQQVLADAQQRLSAYEEAQSLLDESIAHTSGERVLVEYYLSLEDLVQGAIQAIPPGQGHTPRLSALADVQHRVEHVGAPNEED
ncbi:MAG: hypothetical protein ACJ797_17595 [Ktedonobacteraceae bacterium]